MKGITHDREEPRKPVKMKVLLALEEEYRTYLEAMAAAIREFRPNIEVVAITGSSEVLERR
jgi:UDP-N-acetylmuramyl pentapeptide synthase